MKRFLSAALCGLTLCFTMLPAFAAELPAAAETITLENGGRLETGVGEPLLKEGREDGFVTSFFSLLRFFKRLYYYFAGIQTVKKTKYLRYYDQNGALLWEAALTAEFTYSKKRARCESAELSFVTLDRDWELVSRQTVWEDATARGEIEVRQTKLGVPLQTIRKTLVLTCDTAGNVT